MRLWMLILLSVVMFIPVPVFVWREALKDEAGPCGGDVCPHLAPKTFMPSMQQEPFAKAQQIEQDNAEPRQKRQACKHGRNFQPITGFYNAPGKAGAGAGAGYKFGDHGSYQRQPPGYFSACQD